VRGDASAIFFWGGGSCVEIVMRKTVEGSTKHFVSFLDGGGRARGREEREGRRTQDEKVLWDSAYYLKYGGKS